MNNFDTAEEISRWELRLCENGAAYVSHPVGKPDGHPADYLTERVVAVGTYRAMVAAHRLLVQEKPSAT